MTYERPAGATSGGGSAGAGTVTGAVYADYYAATVDEKGFLKDGFSGDGLHPNAKGYELMAPVATAALQKALN